MEMATREEMDALKKTIHEVTEAVKNGQTGMTDQITLAVKSALANHPGFTPERKTIFADNGATPAQEILESMPKEAQMASDDSFFLSKILKKPVLSLKSWKRFERIAGDFKKALDATNSGEGQAWIPTEFSPALWEKVHLSLKVAALFQNIPMPSNPYTPPVELNDFNTFVLAENTEDTGQTIMPVSDDQNLTGNFTLTAKAHGGRVLLSKQIEEDSIVPMLPLVRSRLVAGIARGREDIVVNGDTAGTHEDSDTTSATSRRKHFLGLRANANDQSYKQDLATFNITNLRAMRVGMGVYGVDPSRIAWVVGIKGFFKLIGLPECITVDKLGPNATILAGQMATFDGSPLIVSEQIRQNLNAAGVYDGVTTSKTVLHCVHRDGFVFGTRKDVVVQLLSELYAIYNQDALLINERIAFRDTYPIASNASTYMGYNFA